MSQVYETTKAIENTVGDARSNGAHWRSVLDKKVTIPAGFRFTLDEGGDIKEAGRTRGSTGLRSVDFMIWDGMSRSELKRAKLGKALINLILAESEAVPSTTSESLRALFPWSEIGGVGLLAIKAAASLGVSENDLLTEMKRIDDASNKD